MKDDDHDAWRTERNRILREMDCEAASTQAPHLPMDVIIAGMHKARYHCTDIEPSLRLESGEWLRSMGMQSGFGPLLPSGELP